jgi:hypothetical protein
MRLHPSDHLRGPAPDAPAENREQKSRVKDARALRQIAANLKNFYRHFADLREHADELIAIAERMERKPEVEK